jgi:hypothetical protein
MKFQLPVLLLAIASPLLWAQEPSALKLPEGPLLNRVPAPSAWSITQAVSDPDAPAAAPGATASLDAATAADSSVITVIKEGNLIFEQMLSQNGMRVETWRTGELAVINYNKSGWFIVPGKGTTFNITDYTKSDFAGFDWVSLDNFAGPHDVNGKHCITFKSRVITADPQDIANMRSIYANKVIARNVTAAQTGKAAEPLPQFDMDSFKSDVEADIDNETRLPVQLIYKGRDGKTVTRSYSFQPAPTPLAPPPEVQKLLKDFQDRVRRTPTGPAPI